MLGCPNIQVSEAHQPQHHTLISDSLPGELDVEDPIHRRRILPLQ
jgi:hypothetical protein